MKPDEPSEEERLEELPEDNETPFRPADPQRDTDVEADSDRQAAEEKVLDTHPATDTDIVPEGLYQDGINGEAQIEEPNAGNAVVGYVPPAEDEASNEDEA